MGLKQPLHSGKYSHKVHFCTGSCCPWPQRSHWPTGEGIGHSGGRCVSGGSYLDRERSTQMLAHNLSKHFRQEWWPSSHTPSSAGGPCSRGSQTSQPWGPPCIWRALTQCTQNGVYSARAGYSCQDCCLEVPGSAAVPVAAELPRPRAILL